MCVLPFNQLSVGTIGDLRLCCSSLSGSIIDGEPVSVIGKTDLKFFTESPHLNRIRQSLINGEQPKECSRCWTMEKTGQTSFRDFANSQFPETFNRLLAGDTSVSLEYLNFDLGNKCNIACRMCTPMSSSLVAKEAIKGEGILPKYEVNLAKSAIHQADIFSWIEKPEFWDLIRPRLKEVRSVYLIGGEPFIIPEHLKLLDLLIEHGRPEEITLCYNSNLSVFPERIFERWRKFKLVKVNASIDGINEIYEYIRWPMKFDKISSNLERLDREQLPNVVLAVHSTIQNLNVCHLVDFLKFFYGKCVVFIPVHHPTYLSIAVMPLSDLEKALSDLQDFKMGLGSDVPDYFTRAVDDALCYIADAVKNHQPDFELQKQFMKIMDFHDRRRNQSLIETHPYFQSWCDA